MPIHPNVRQCTHIKITGHRCGSPALKQEYFCYFHTRMIKGVATRVDSQIHPIALIENAEAIQAALMHMIDAVLKGTIDNKRANILLKALHIAVRNARNVHFNIAQYDMVQEIPNYAQQYLTEHPELTPPEPPQANTLEPRATESNKTAAQPNTGPDHAVNPAAERRQNAAHGASRGNRAKNHQAPEERKRTYDPSHVDSGCSSGPGTNSPPKEEACAGTTPPPTTDQSERRQEIEKLEASIEGAMRGNWRDLRTVFNAVGLTPRKPPASSSHRKARGTKQKM